MSNDLQWDRFWAKLPKRVNDALLRNRVASREDLVRVTKEEFLRWGNFGPRSLANVVLVADLYNVALHPTVGPHRVLTDEGVEQAMPAINALIRAKAAIDDATCEVRKAVQTSLVVGRGDAVPMSLQDVRYLVLSIEEDLSTAEIAEALKVSRARVYEIRSRLLARLRAVIDRETGDKEGGGS